MFSCIIKRLASIKYFLPPIVLAFIASKAAHYWMNKDTPPFLVEMEEKLPTNSYIVARIGENVGFKDTYNENDLLKDTLKYTFSLAGSKGTMHIKGYATKQQGKWVPIKGDTLFAK